MRRLKCSPSSCVVMQVALAMVVWSGGCLLCWFGAVLFGTLILMRGSPFPSATSSKCYEHMPTFCLRVYSSHVPCQENIVDCFKEERIKKRTPGANARGGFSQIGDRKCKPGAVRTTIKANLARWESLSIAGLPNRSTVAQDPHPFLLIA